MITTAVVVVVVVGIVARAVIAVVVVGLALGSSSSTPSMRDLVIIIMYTRMPRKFVGAGEPFFAAWEGAYEGFFAGVGSYVAGLEVAETEGEREVSKDMDGFEKAE